MRDGVEGLRVVAALVALGFLVGGRGNLFVATALAAVSLGRRAVPAVPAGVGLLLIAAVAVSRAGSSGIGDVAGAHAVLGAAALSPSVGIAAAAVLAAVGSVVIATVLVAPLARRGALTLSSFRRPGPLADGLGPVLAVLLGVTAAAGPPVVAAQPPSWLFIRLGLVAGGLGLALSLCRWVPPRVEKETRAKV